MQFHAVAFLPLALDAGITLILGILDRLAVYLDGIIQPLAIGIVIEIAGHHLVAHPARDTNLQVELPGAVLVYRQDDIPIPGVAGDLFQSDFLAIDLHLGGIRHKEIHIEVFPFRGIDIARQRGDEAADVRRTAGASEPRLALVLPDALQRVGIEEGTSVEGYARD